MESSEMEQIEIPDLSQLNLVNSPNSPNHVSASALTNNPSPTLAGEADRFQNAGDSPRTPASFGTSEDDEKPTAEYALHILFTRFVRYTEKKLALLQHIPEDAIESLLGVGADAEFDLILESMGHVARRRPKPVIDSIMYWRKTKRDQSSVSLASLYVLCRALMEVIRQTPHEVLGERLSEKLEDIVFKQLVSAEPEVIASSGIRGANWRYLARLLGEMSSFRLASVDDRFIAELEKKVTTRAQEARACLLLEAMQFLKIKLYPEEFLEESSIFLESLSKFYTRTPFNSSLRSQYAKTIGHMLESLAESITVEVNQPMWAATMEALFKASQEKPSGGGLAGRTSSSASQGGSQSVTPAFELSVMSLCLSPQPIFSKHWLSLLDNFVQKNKTKPQKIIKLLPAAARLTWVYIFRCGESLNLTTKKIESLRKLFLSNTSRKYWQAVDADRDARGACVSLLRSAFQGYQQHTLDELLFPMLVGTDSTSVAQHQAIAFDSSVLPERAGIAVDVFTEVMKDLRTGIRPPFPSEVPSSNVSSASEGIIGAKEAARTELPHRPMVTAALQASIDLFGSCIGQISSWLEQGGSVSEPAIRQNSVSQLVSLASGGNNSNSVNLESHRIELGVDSAEQQLLLAFLTSWPSWWTADQHLRHLDVLCRCVGHTTPAISEAAVVSIRKLASETDINVLFTPFTKALMAADARNAESLHNSGLAAASSGTSANSDFGSSPGLHHRSSSSIGFGSSLNLGLGLGFHMNSSSNDYDTPSENHDPNYNKRPVKQVSSYVLLYVELIELWIGRLQNGDPAVTTSSVDSQLLSLWAAVEEIEGNGLFFLCSQDMQIRTLGLRILWLTTTMDQSILNYEQSQPESRADSKPLRIINLLQNTPISQVAQSGASKFELSMPERNRLAKFRSKRASLARLVESSYGVDSALWLKMFPTFISLCFESHPIPVALCRNIVSDRLVHMHDSVLAIASTPGSNPTSYGSVAVIEQWKIYLIVACATLTSTEEQKMHVPTTSTSSSLGSVSHTRKRSQQKITLHHQRITSARSVFRIVTPLLGSEKNSVRDAIVSGLSCTNVNTYKTLLECLQPILSDSLPKFYQLQKQASGNKTASTAPGDSLLRVVTGIAQIVRQTTGFLEDKRIRLDVWIRNEVVSVLRQLREVLGSVRIAQSSPLRVSFCELLTETYTALGPSLMFTGRAPAGEWLLFWQTVERWSPFGSNAATVLENRTMMSRRAQNDVVLAQFEIFKRDIDRSTSRALAALLRDSQGFINDLGSVLQWVYALLSSNSDYTSQDIGRSALENLLVSHASSPELLLEVVSRCYHNSSERSRGVAKVYFVALVNMLESHPDLIKSRMEKPQQFLALALFKIGDPDCETRFRAVKLMELVENGLYGSSIIAGEYQFRLRSSSATVYKREIFVLSGKLASERSHESFYLFSQMTRAFQAVNDSDRRDILSVLLPWIQNIEFRFDDDAGLQMVLVNLLEITAVFSRRMQHEVEALWVALCTSTNGSSSNALRVLDFLLSFCLQYRTPGAVAVSRTVLIYLLASPASGAITEKLLNYLEPSYMITQSGNHHLSSLISSSCEEEYPYVASLDEVVALANEKESNAKNATLPPFSYGQLAVIFLVDTISASSQVLPKLASLVHVCLVLGDHFVGLLQDKTRELLLNVAGMFNSDPKSMQKLTDLLSSLRWQYEDDAGAVPDQLGELVAAITEHLEVDGALDYREWSQIAIQWATSSPVRHIACRSLQIYRCLNLHIDSKMLGDLLVRLSSTISEHALDIQGFATQILMTLNSIVDKMDSKQLLSYPSLIWASIASLSSANEREYMEALSMLGKVLSKWDDSIAHAAIKAFPPRWDGTLEEFDGIMPLVLRGLRSQNAAALSHETLHQLTALSKGVCEESALILFGKKDPLPLFLASNLPWFLHAMDQPHLVSGLAPTAELLNVLVAPISSSLAKILDSFVKRRFWSKSDFLRQYVLALPAAFPEQLEDILVLFMSMVNNSAPVIRMASLEILKTLIPEEHAYTGSFHSKWQGAGLIAPLLRLLTTPDVEEALSVLDIVGSVKPDRLDKDVLRMTLGSRQLFREYENTETPFGIPDESGWSVPVPAQAAIVTRNNIHAIFYVSVAGNASDEYEADETPTVDGAQVFQNEEYAPLDSSLYRANSTQGSNHQAGTESMDKILTDLDEFDSFFTRVAAPRSSHRNSGKRGNDKDGPNQTPPRHPYANTSTTPINSGHLKTSPQSTPPSRQDSISRSRFNADTESIPQLYDKKVSLILNRSLARTPSQVSFRTSFGDSFSRGPSSSSSQPSVPGLSNRPLHHRQHSSQSMIARSVVNQGLGEGGANLSASRSRMSLDSTTTTIADSQEFDNSALFSTASLVDGIYRGSSTDNALPETSLGEQKGSDGLYSRGRSLSTELEAYDFFAESEELKQAKTPDKKKSKKGSSSKAQAETSFRLESLLRGKRRSKGEPRDKSTTMQSHMDSNLATGSFQFPPR